MDSDDDQEETSSWRGVPSTIVLINIFDSTNTKTAEIAKEATLRVLRQHLRLASSNLIGVCLIGADNSNTSALGIKNIVDVIPLSAPTLDDYKKLKNLKFASQERAKEFMLSEVLWHCSKMFANSKKQLSSRTIIFLTRLDTPPISTDEKPTLKRVVDLVDSGIEIKIINVSENDYEMDKYYHNFLFEANKGKDFIIPRPLSDVNKIENLIKQESRRNMAVAKINFVIGEGVSISVGIYNLVIKSDQLFKKKVNLDRESNAVVRSVTETYKVTSDANAESQECAPIQMPVLKSELLYCQDYGGETVQFTESEMKMLKNPFGPPMLKLLGFKPNTVLCKEKWFMKTGYFLYPNESVIEGSTVAFKALHEACNQTGVVAICVLCTRVNAKPNIVALAPCFHPLGLDVELGFDVIQIPFVEHVRDITVPKEDETQYIDDKHKEFLKEVLKKAQFNFTPQMFENPKLQSEYRAVEAIALDDEDLEPFTDTTKPDSERFRNIEEDKFEELFGPFKAVAKKRPTNKHSDDGKKIKEFDEAELQDRLKYKTVNKYTVEQLKTILLSRNHPDIPSLTNLKKKELCDLVYEYGAQC